MSRAREFADLAGSADSGGLTGRNLIINGAMQGAQRGTSFSSLSASEYTCDRWQLQVAGAGRGTVTQESSGGPVGFKDNFLRVTVATADSSVASSDMQVLKQVIEGHVAAFTDAGTSDAQPLTLSFYVRSSVTGTFSATLYTNFNSPNAVSYPAEYTISSANTWEQKTITYPAFTTSSTLATSGYTTGEFYQVRFALMAGSDKTGTANQWNNANDFASTNQTNLFATSSATWDITGIQLEVGEKATPFEHRSFADELARCERYATVYPPASVTAEFKYAIPQSSNVCDVANRPEVTIFYPEKRADPTITHIGNTTSDWRVGLANNTNLTPTGISQAVGNGRRGSVFFITVSSGVSTNSLSGVAVYFYSNGGRVVVDAEL